MPGVVLFRNLDESFPNIAVWNGAVDALDVAPRIANNLQRG
jgi:hypothetical protein